MYYILWLIQFIISYILQMSYQKIKLNEWHMRLMTFFEYKFFKLAIISGNKIKQRVLKRRMKKYTIIWNNFEKKWNYWYIRKSDFENLVLAK